MGQRDLFGAIELISSRFCSALVNLNAEVYGSRSTQYNNKYRFHNSRHPSLSPPPQSRSYKTFQYPLKIPWSLGIESTPTNIKTFKCRFTERIIAGKALPLVLTLPIPLIILQFSEKAVRGIYLNLNPIDATSPLPGDYFKLFWIKINQNGQHHAKQCNTVVELKINLIFKFWIKINSIKYF